NFPPRISNTDVLEVEVGKSYPNLVTVHTTDPNGDPFYYYLEPGTAAGVSLNNATHVLSWNTVPDGFNLTIGVAASDEFVSTLWRPRIEL
ncbi:hypothetical protein ACJMK2_015390, partial [Sinanodonta woodiana]